MNTWHESRDFRVFQAAFAARIRDPDGQQTPAGISERGMRVYEELLFNNLEGFLLACFPVTRKLLGERAWNETVRRFFAEHRCASPLFRDIPGEFLDWMEPRAADLFPERPYLYEFMHYEWLELTVSLCPEEAEAIRDEIDPDGDLLMEQPILNPTAQLVCYQYPVHRIDTDFESTGPDGQSYWYLLYRDREDAVRFIVLNPVSAHLLELLRDADITGDQAIKQISQALNHDHPEHMLEMGRSLLEELRRTGALSGTRSTR